MKYRKLDVDCTEAPERGPLVQQMNGQYFFITREGKWVGPFCSELEALEARNLFVYRVKYSREMPELVATDMSVYQKNRA